MTVLAVSVRLHMSIISQDGWSAMMLAANEGHTEVVTQLLEAGANTDLLLTEVYTTPVLYVWCALIRVILLYACHQSETCSSSRMNHQ